MSPSAESPPIRAMRARAPADAPLRSPIVAPLAVAVAIATLVPIALVVAQDGGSAGGPDGDAAERRRATIQRELATLGRHPWAGEYYEGDGLGANISLALAPSGGVAVTWTGCLGLYGANQGRVIERDGTLRFAYEAPNADGFPGFPEAVLPVRWGERRYLVPERKLVDFVNAIHRGFEPRDRIHGMFLLAEGDEAKPVQGLPALPPRHLAMIRSRSLEARVTAVERRETRKDAYGCTTVYRLTLDRGSRDGLAPGLELSPQGERTGIDTVVVERVAEASATGRFAPLWDDCAQPKKAPGIGWRFATGAYDPARTQTRMR